MSEEEKTEDVVQEEAVVAKEEVEIVKEDEMKEVVDEHFEVKEGKHLDIFNTD